jgi:hypothetical protein
MKTPFFAKFAIGVLVVFLGLTAYNVHGSNKRQMFAMSQSTSEITLRTEGLWDRQLVIEAGPEYDSQTLADLMTKDSFLADQIKAVGFKTVRVANVVEEIQ